MVWTRVHRMEESPYKERRWDGWRGGCRGEGYIGGEGVCRHGWGRGKYLRGGRGRRWKRVRRSWRLCTVGLGGFVVSKGACGWNTFGVHFNSRRREHIFVPATFAA